MPFIPRGLTPVLALEVVMRCESAGLESHVLHLQLVQRRAHDLTKTTSSRSKQAGHGTIRMTARWTSFLAGSQHHHFTSTPKPNSVQTLRITEVHLPSSPLRNSGQVIFPSPGSRGVRTDAFLEQRSWGAGGGLRALVTALSLDPEKFWTVILNERQDRGKPLYE